MRAKPGPQPIHEPNRPPRGWIGILLAIGLIPLVASPPVAAQTDEAILGRSLVTPGDPARLQHALAKARRGEPVTVAGIGGSITKGAKATSPDKNYASLFARWWQETFPNSRVELVNAGIGATGSNYGALRAQRDLLGRKPDVVVVEYGVNDPNLQATAETLEGLVRQILKQPGQPAVLLLFTMHRDGKNAQEWHGKIGRHYGLPMISFRDGLWPEIEAGRMKWEDVEFDHVHPNDRGHAYAATFLTTHLASVLRQLPADDRLPPRAPLPRPLIGDLFEHVTLVDAENLKPVENTGWAYDAESRSWKSDRPGSRIVFEIEGRVILADDWHINGPMGKARVQVDDRPAVVRDAWYDKTWGGYRRTQELARDLAPGRHRVAVEVLPERNPQSTGHEYRVLGLGAAGVTKNGTP